MAKHVSKFGTDSRYPYWHGGTLDYNFFQGAVTVALILNWGFIGFVHSNVFDIKIVEQFQFGIGTRIFLATTICLATIWSIKHPDWMVRNFTRVFACGIPLAFNYLMLYLRVMAI